MIIGLIGLIGSGKGSVGDILVRDYGFTQDAFAAPLKDAAANIFGWDRELLEGDTPESRAWREVPDPYWSTQFGHDFTPRLALQLLGTEAGRKVFHEDIWVASLINRISKRSGSTVITDVRFKNEICAIQKIGGVVVRVQRGPDPDWFPAALCANRGDTAAVEEMKTLGIHQSEWDWVGCSMNYTIYNDGTLKDLQAEVKQLLEIEPELLTRP